MKKIIFLTLFLKSFVSAADGVDCSTLEDYYNPATDLATAGYTTSTYFYGNSSILPPKLFCSPTYGSTTAMLSLSYTTISTDSYKSINTRYYTITKDYTGCPDGQEIINGACATPPTCSTGTIWNPQTDKCVPIVYPDSDGDGTPDKCDFDYKDYKIMDCDLDGILNGTDDDVDGDGAKNDLDMDLNGDGVPDASDPSSPVYSKSCKGSDWSRSNLLYGISYYKEDYSYRGTLTNSSCLALKDTNINIDSIMIVPDFECVSTYCYTHDKKSNCNYKASDYEPLFGDWVYLSNIKNTNDCYAQTVLYPNKFSEYKFEIPSSSCPSISFCFLKRVYDDNNTTPYEYAATEDPTSKVTNDETNTTMTVDFSPIVNEQKSTNKILETLKSNSDITNNNLSDLKDTANSLLTTNKDMSTSLSTLVEDGKKSLQNQLDSLTSLSIANDSLTSLNQKASDTNTYLSGTNNRLDGSNKELAAINSNLNTINNTLLNGDGTSPDTSSFDGFDTSLDDFSSFVDSATSQFSTFKTNFQGQYDGILQQYEDTKTLLETGQIPVMSGGGSLDCASFDMLGRHFVLDLSKVSIISPIVYYLFTAFFMVLNFRFLINHLFSRGD